MSCSLAIRATSASSFFPPLCLPSGVILTPEGYVVLAHDRMWICRQFTVRHKLLTMHGPAALISFTHRYSEWTEQGWVRMKSRDFAWIYRRHAEGSPETFAERLSAHGLAFNRSPAAVAMLPTLFMSVIDGGDFKAVAKAHAEALFKKWGVAAPSDALAMGGV